MLSLKGESNLAALSILAGCLWFISIRKRSLVRTYNEVSFWTDVKEALFAALLTVPFKKSTWYAGPISLVVFGLALYVDVHCRRF